MERTQSQEPSEPQPWQGRVYDQVYPPTEARREMRDAIMGALTGHEYKGQVSSELSEQVAYRAYEQSEGEIPPFKVGDIKLELSKMIGTAVRLAPNNHIFPDIDWQKANTRRVQDTV